MNWESQTKTDLAVEVWEKLDCESVGEAEILAIETVLNDKFGKNAVSSPMKLARFLASEGAYLRHDEVMRLHVRRFSEDKYDTIFREISNLSSFSKAKASLACASAIKKRFISENDKIGVKLLRETFEEIKETLEFRSKRRRYTENEKAVFSEIASWIEIWLRAPEVFENWVVARENSNEFEQRFNA